MLGTGIHYKTIANKLTNQELHIMYFESIYNNIQLIYEAMVKAAETDSSIQLQLKKISFQQIKKALEDAEITQVVLENELTETRIAVGDFDAEGDVISNLEDLKAIVSLLEFGYLNDLLDKNVLDSLKINTDNRISNFMLNPDSATNQTQNYFVFLPKIRKTKGTSAFSPENPVHLVDYQACDKALQDWHNRIPLNEDERFEYSYSMEQILDFFQDNIFGGEYSRNIIFEAITDPMTGLLNRHARNFAEDMVRNIGYQTIRMGGEEIETYIRVNVKEKNKESGHIEEVVKKFVIVGDFDNFGVLNSFEGSKLDSGYIIPIPGDVKISIIAVHMESYGRRVHNILSSRVYTIEEAKNIIQDELAITNELITEALLQFESEILGISKQDVLMQYQAILKDMKPLDQHFTFGTGTFHYAYGEDNTPIFDIAHFADVKLTQAKENIKVPERGTTKSSEFVERRIDSKKDLLNIRTTSRRNYSFDRKWSEKEKAAFLLRNVIHEKLMEIDFGVVTQEELESYLKMPPTSLKAFWKALRLTNLLNEYDQLIIRDYDDIQLIRDILPGKYKAIRTFLKRKIDKSVYRRNGYMDKNARKMARTDFLTGDLNTRALFRIISQKIEENPGITPIVFKFSASKLTKISNEGLSHLGGDFNIKITNRIIEELLEHVSIKRLGNRAGLTYFLAKRFDPIIASFGPSNGKAARNAKKFQYHIAIEFVKNMQKVMQGLSIEEIMDTYGITDKNIAKDALAAFLDVAEQFGKKIAYMRKPLMQQAKTEIVQFEEVSMEELQYYSYFFSSYDNFLRNFRDNNVEETSVLK